MRTDYGRYILSKRETCCFCVIGYVTAFTVFYLFYHSVAFSAAGGFLPCLLLGRYSLWKAEKRRALLTTQFKDLLYSLSASAAANRQMADALADGLESLRAIYAEKTPLIMELTYMVKGMAENKESDIRLLSDFAERSHCEDIDHFVQVYTICRTMGGDMESVLKSTAEILMDKINIEREIRTLTAQKKLEGNIISIMPLMVLLCLTIFSPDYVEPLYATLAGRLVMTAALTGLGAAFVLTRKLTNIEV